MVIFIPNQRYTERDHKRLGVEYLLKKGLNIEVWDIDKILFPHKEKRTKQYIFNGYKEFNIESEFIEAFRSLNRDDYIFIFSTGRKFINILYKIRAITDAKFISYSGGAIPITHYRCIFKSKESIKIFLKTLIYRIYYPFKFPLDIIFLGSKKDRELSFGYIGKRTKLIEVHSRDYNLCLEIENRRNRVYSYRYCLFLDTDIIDSLDYEILNIDYNITEEQIENYYKKLIYFFKWIEREYNLKVIIAGHPKSKKFSTIKNFYGFDVFINRSAELVKDAEFILTEGSTAISFAIFFNKPLILFTMREIDFFKHTCIFANILKKEIISVENLQKEQFNRELKNLKEYKNYKYSYLTYTGDRQHSFEVIYRVLNNGNSSKE